MSALELSPRPFAYDGPTRAEIALEDELKRCPACHAEPQSRSSTQAVRGTREFCIAWRCGAAAVVWIMQGGSITTRRIDPCQHITKAGIMRAVEVARAAFTCTEIG